MRLDISSGFNKGNECRANDQAETSKLNMIGLCILQAPLSMKLSINNICIGSKVLYERESLGIVYKKNKYGFNIFWPDSNEYTENVNFKILQLQNYRRSLHRQTLSRIIGAKII